MACNLHWRDVEALLLYLGATVEPSHGARVKVVLNGHEFFFRHPGHCNEMSRIEVKRLREELIGAGVDRAEMADMREEVGQGKTSGKGEGV